MDRSQCTALWCKLGCAHPKLVDKTISIYIKKRATLPFEKHEKSREEAISCEQNRKFQPPVQHVSGKT